MKTVMGSCKYPGENCLGRGNPKHGFFCCTYGDDPEVVLDFKPMTPQDMEELYGDSDENHD